ncbi:MAG: tol-pal system protein YbgF [Chitinispirillaceae bacterium]
MEKKYSIPGIGIFLFLVGCAPSLDQMENETLLPEIDIVQLKENSDEALKLSQETKLEFQTINSRLTDIDNRIVVLNEEVSSVSLAKIEEIENRLALLIEAYKDLYETVSALEVLPQVRVNKKKTRPAPTFSPTSAAGLLSSNEYDLYRKALDTFDQRNYQKARKMFADVLKQYPEGKYSANSHYWVGECFYAMGDYASAIAAFNKVLEYARGTKKDDAQMKLGMSYLLMGNNSQAQKEFTNLVNRYPNSEYIPRAKRYLTNIQ